MEEGNWKRNKNWTVDKAILFGAVAFTFSDFKFFDEEARFRYG